MKSCATTQGCLSGVSAPVQGEVNLRLQAEIAGATQQADQARKSLVDWLADAVASKLSLAASTQHLHTAGGPAVAAAGNRQADELADISQVAAYLKSCNDPVKAAPTSFSGPSGYQVCFSSRPQQLAQSRLEVGVQQCSVPCHSLTLTETAPHGLTPPWFATGRPASCRCRCCGGWRARVGGGGGWPDGSNGTAEPA